MDISGKKQKIWRQDVEGRNGTFYRYSVNISSKREDGTYASMYLPIRFAKKANAPEKISNGTECDFSGFLTVDTFNGRDGEVKQLMIIAMSASFYSANETKDVPDSYEQLEEDLPFN